MAIFNWWQSGWEPFEDIYKLQDELGKLFDVKFRGQWPFRYLKAINQEFPAINVYETKDGYELIADLPGVDPKELDLVITASTITLKGDRKAPKEEGKKALKQERVFGHFARAITLPDEIDNAKVAASYTEGLLKIHMPKREETKPKQIQVKVE